MAESKKIVLGTHRVSYLHLSEPTAFAGDENSKPRYDCTFLIPYNHPDVARIQAAIHELATAEANGILKGVSIQSPKFWNPLRDGAEWLAEHPEAVEYSGCYFIKASSTSQPKAFYSDKQEIIDLSEVYSGCYCRGVIAPFAFNNKSKGIGFFLNSVMKMQDGERLGGFTANPDDYDEAPQQVVPQQYAPPPTAVPGYPLPTQPYMPPQGAPAYMPQTAPPPGHYPPQQANPADVW